MPEWKGKTGGGNKNQGLLMHILKRVNIRVIYLTLPFVVCYYLIFAPRRAYSIYSYLRHRQGFSFFRAAVGTYRNHIIFGKLLLDRFYIFAGHRERYKISNMEKELVEKYFSTPKPLVMVSAHVGNFEISSYLCGRLSKKLNVLAFAGETEQMQKFRAMAMRENNIEIIGVSETMEHIFKINDAFANSEALTLTGDRVFTGRRNHKFNFLGKEAMFPTAIYNMAERYDADLITMFVLWAGKNFTYKIVVEPITIDSSIKGRDARAQAYGQAYVSILEKVVKEYPLQWFNFYDFWRSAHSADYEKN